MPSRARSQTRSSKGKVSRSKSKSQSRSRSRSRSRGRPPSRARTPTRGKSPARNKKTSQEKTTSRSKAPPRETTPELEIIPDEKPVAVGSSRQRATKVASTPKTSTPKPHTAPARQSMRLAMKSLGSEEVMSDFVDAETEKTNAADVPPPASYQYGGPVGAFFLILLLPLTVLLINIMLDQVSGGVQWPVLSTRCSDYFDLRIFLGVVGWLLFLAVSTCLPLGQKVRVKTGKNNKDTQYHLNGLCCMVLALAVLGGLLYKGYSLQFIHKNFTQLIVSATLLCHLISALLYWRSRNLPTQQSNPNATSGVFVYDYLMGRHLNPTVGPLYMKVFLIRVALVSWCLLNALLLHQAHITNKLSVNLLLVVAFQSLYLIDHCCLEKISSLSLAADGAGFLLCHAMMVWVPFIYTIQTRYLLLVPQSSTYPLIAAYVVLYGLGYLVFRGSKSQKDKFRSDPRSPAFAGLETIPTSCGRRLLADGWWGLVRHPNYLGDILLSLAWTLPCGFSSPLPWVYIFFFVLLFVDRAELDHSVCKAKYGPAWAIYCQKVPYKIIPGVY